MPEVKELAKEFVKASANKITSHLLAYIDGDDSVSLSFHASAPSLSDPARCLEESLFRAPDTTAI
jgi:hypothetical protein